MRLTHPTHSQNASLFLLNLTATGFIYPENPRCFCITTIQYSFVRPMSTVITLNFSDCPSNIQYLTELLPAPHKIKIVADSLLDKSKEFSKFMAL